MWLGRILLWAAMAVAIITAFAYFQVERKLSSSDKSGSDNEFGLKKARRWFLLTGALIFVTMLYLWWLIMTERYEVAYVHDYTNRELPTLYRFAAFWGGQAGTWILWAFFTVLWGFLVWKLARPYEPATMAILSGMIFLLLLPAAIEDPFRISHPNATDGRGLNPLLHNFWMALHPPSMFLGYASMGLPFALALAGLWRKDWHGWTRYALPAACFGTAALGLGITLGGIWSYEVLGWGGYWAWDPVENASFIPWLACAGLMHLLVIQRTTKSAARAVTFLALLTFLTTYYATFVTRSGFVQSVHSFGTSPISWWILGIMLGLTILSFGLFFLRMRQVPPVEGKPILSGLASLNTFLYFGTASLFLLAVVIFAGLSLPWLTLLANALGLTQFAEVGVDRTFYDRASFPFGLAMCLLLALFPLSVLVRPQNEDSAKEWVKAVPWLIINITLLTALLAFLFGIRQPVSLILIGVASTCLVTNFYALYLRVKQSPLTIGAYLAHIGLALFILGVVGSELHDSARQLVIPAGGHRTAYGFLFTYSGINERPDGKLEAKLEVHRVDRQERASGKPEFVATPIFWDTAFGLVRTPFIKRYLTHDIYIEPIELQDAQAPGTLTLVRGEERQVGNWKIKFVRFHLAGKAVMGMPSQVGAVLELNDGKKTYTATPYWDLDKGTKHEAKIPEKGITVALESMNAESRSVTLHIDGIEGLHGHSGFIVINVQKKPAVNLVWFGAMLILLGSLLAGLRRMRETVKAQTKDLRTERKERKVKKVAA
ncbi:cytochrome c-type biogenesis protein CcmF [Candidatus Fervidibacteria bacterium JGI MDM2 JNZ-1-D12]